MSAPTILGGRGLTAGYDGMDVFEALEVELRSAECTVVTGPNGAGKSTLLRCLAGTQPLESGHLELDTEPIDPTGPEHWRDVLAILDQNAWLPDLTVADHLLLVGDGNTVDTAMRRVGLTPELGDRLPGALSSGQRQRAALSVAVVRPWRVLLLDEPERHLDGDGVAIVADLLRDLTGEGRTVAIATHSTVLRSLPGVQTLQL
ncbi:ABC transporter ATP-binding protein [Aeromicrobium sp. CF3.5]|uniref:ABC transporter ATP-binding protein n=1 Tax=Aeromicrobium sp. CF3.5 TaxID=3373078 RepID=UPI003EE7C25A